MTVLIGGGSGFIGRQLSKEFLKNGWKVTWVSRSAGKNRITWKDLQHHGLPSNCTAVVSLSGENILNPLKRWNDEFKSEVRSSRIDTTRDLVTAIIHAEQKPQVFVSMSGVAYYKPDLVKEYTEATYCKEYDFLSKLTSEWEDAAKLPKSLNIREVIVRSGVVLGRHGGMINHIHLPFQMGFGGKIGSGKQWFPWIHLHDIAGILCHAVRSESVHGVLNGVAPNPITNLQFTKAYAAAMRRPCVFPTPSFVMNTIFGPERGKVMLEGQKVLPSRTLESGYRYVYPDITSACKEII